MDTEYQNQLALDIVMEKIAEVTNLYAKANTDDEIEKFRNKLNLLEEFKLEIYKGNSAIIDKVIRENKKGNI